MAHWLARLMPWFGKSVSEGLYRPGPYVLEGGWLSATAGKYLNWWQMGFH